VTTTRASIDKKFVKLGQYNKHFILIFDNFWSFWFWVSRAGACEWILIRRKRGGRPRTIFWVLIYTQGGTTRTHTIVTNMEPKFLGHGYMGPKGQLFTQHFDLMSYKRATSKLQPLHLLRETHLHVSLREPPRISWSMHDGWRMRGFIKWAPNLTIPEMSGRPKALSYMAKLNS
jgi:hypothetical protein